MNEPSNFAKVRLRLSLSLYYKLLDAIIRDEYEKKNQDFGAVQVRGGGYIVGLNLPF